MMPDQHGGLVDQPGDEFVHQVAGGHPQQEDQEDGSLENPAVRPDGILHTLNLGLGLLAQKDRRHRGATHPSLPAVRERLIFAGGRSRNMRKTLFWTGWAILFVLPVIFGIQIFMTQDLPPVQLWKWGVLGGAILLIYFARNRDEVFKHHIA